MKEWFRREALFSPDLFSQGLKTRWRIVAILALIQTLYFPINQLHSGGVTLDLDFLDGAMPRVSYFVIIYQLGLVYIGAANLIAAITLPRDLFQKHIIAFLFVMLIGFSIWIIFPALVEKKPFTPNGFFDEILHSLHDSDDDFGTHNAFPSSHIYYVTVGLFFLSQRFKKQWFWFGLVAFLNAMSTMLTHQHYFIDILAGFILTWFGIWMTLRFFAPTVQRFEIQRGIVAESNTTRANANQL